MSGTSFLRELCRLYDNEDFNGIQSHGIDDVDDLCELMVGHYLAEHPADDDREITAEWLEAVGFGLLPDDADWVKCYTIGDLCVDRSQQSNYWTLTNGGTAVLQKHPETRGDVRRLCSALGIELKETATATETPTIPQAAGEVT